MTGPGHGAGANDGRGGSGEREVGRARMEELLAGDRPRTDAERDLLAVVGALRVEADVPLAVWERVMRTAWAGAPADSSSDALAADDAVGGAGGAAGATDADGGDAAAADAATASAASAAEEAPRPGSHGAARRRQSGGARASRGGRRTLGRAAGAGGRTPGAGAGERPAMRARLTAPGGRAVLAGVAAVALAVAVAVPVLTGGGGSGGTDDAARRPAGGREQPSVGRAEAAPSAGEGGAAGGTPAPAPAPADAAAPRAVGPRTTGGRAAVPTVTVRAGQGDIAGRVVDALAAVRAQGGRITGARVGGAGSDRAWRLSVRVPRERRAALLARWRATPVAPTAGEPAARVAAGTAVAAALLQPTDRAAALRVRRVESALEAAGRRRPVADGVTVRLVLRPGG